MIKKAILDWLMSWKDFNDVPDQFKLDREVVQTDLPKRLEYGDVPNELKGRWVVILTALQHNTEVPFHKLPQRLLSDKILLIEALCLVQAADCEPQAIVWQRDSTVYFRSVCRATVFPKHLQSDEELALALVKAGALDTIDVLEKCPALYASRAWKRQ
jgi:hypothetical protein